MFEWLLIILVVAAIFYAPELPKLLEWVKPHLNKIKHLEKLKKSEKDDKPSNEN